VQGCASTGKGVTVPSISRASKRKGSSMTTAAPIILNMYLINGLPE
jgi:hypothetical protein